MRTDMPNQLRIVVPVEGDVLNRHDGYQTADTLSVIVEGVAPEGAAVEVNGIQVVAENGAFSCPVPLSKRRNRILAKAGEMSHEIEVFWNKGSKKRYRFSIDDNICFLRDLGIEPDKHPSLFDHWYLAFWREMHREFGAKIHMNIYYQTDGFDLTQMPDKWKDEWRENAPWLHLSFHALQDKPDRPYRHARYPQMAHDYDLVTGHIRRFAGNEVLSTTTTVHWAECPLDAAQALRDRGIEQLVALYGVQGYAGECTTDYYLSEEQRAHADTRGAWHDRATGLTFIRCACVVNSIEVEQIDAFLDAQTSTLQTAEMVELLIHEQYFRKELSYYQPTVMEKVRTALRWVAERGYEPVFWSDEFLGSPASIGT